MKKINREIPNWILSKKEESNLSEVDKKNYYQKLREYCINRKLTNTTIGATTIAPKLKKVTGVIVRKLTEFLAGGSVDVIVDGVENIPKEPVIFGCTHQGILDNFVWIADCPKHCLILHGVITNKALLMIQLNTGLVLVAKEKSNRQNRVGAKLDMITLLLKGHCMWVFPETTWNLSPNSLHLPINNGFLDVAQKTNVPVIPVVLEYTWDSSCEKERITQIHIRYGERITVSEQDELAVKLEEYKEKISTIRWNLIEEKGLYKRNEIDNWDYINYVKGNLRNLEMGKMDVNRERAGIQGANQEFYRFHHINDVPWENWGEMRQTDEVERLNLINRLHGI